MTMKHVAQQDPDGNIGAFAASFVHNRLAGFEKDIKICLTPQSRLDGKGKTHVYFPALAACVSTLEYLTGLHRGNTHDIGWAQVADFATSFMRQPDFDRDTVRVLFEALRHPVAHRGIASGVWVDRNAGVGKGRRVVWKLTAASSRPAYLIVAESGEIKRDSPWPCKYSHRVLVHLKVTCSPKSMPRISAQNRHRQDS